MADIDITFPKTLMGNNAGHPSIIRFRVYDNTPTKVGSPSAIIRLPVPLALSNNYAIQFDDLESGLLGKSLETLGGNPKLAEQMNSLLAGGGVDVGKVASGLGESLAQIAQGSLGALAAQSDTLRRLGGFSFNKAGQLTINKPNNRSYNFRFSLVPNDREEANTIQKIIEVFKYAMHPPVPSGAQKFVYLNPARFLIDFLYNPGAKKNQKIFNSYFCFLTGFEVNHHEAGSPAYFEEGYPEQRSISLNFQEVSPLNRQNIKALEPTDTGLEGFDGEKNLDAAGWQAAFELYGNTTIADEFSGQIGAGEQSPRDQQG